MPQLASHYIIPYLNNSITFEKPQLSFSKYSLAKQDIIIIQRNKRNKKEIKNVFLLRRRARKHGQSIKRTRRQVFSFLLSPFPLPLVFLSISTLPIIVEKEKHLERQKKSLTLFSFFPFDRRFTSILHRSGRYDYRGNAVERTETGTGCE